MNFKILLLLLIHLTLIADFFELQDDMKGTSSINVMEIYEDTTRKITIDQVKKQAFKIQDSDITNHGLSSSAWWIKLQVHNPKSQNLTWSIKFIFGLFDHMQMWQFSNDQLLSHSLKGDHHIDPKITPFNERTVFTFNTDSNAKNTIYFRISHNKIGFIETFNSLWTQNHLDTYSQTAALITTAILASLFVLFFYNLFIFFILKSKIYFWYSVYLIGIIIGIVSFNTIGAHYIWRESIFLIDNIPIVAFALANISFMMFTRVFLETNKQVKWIDKFILFFISLEILGLFFAIIDVRFLALKLIYLGGFSFFFFPFIGLYLWKKGFLIARGYTLASTILSITMTIGLLRMSGYVYTDEWLFWLSRSGFIIEGILLSIVLADRINIIQNSYNKTQNELTSNLGSEVKKRTIELEKAKKIAENLARKDMLTEIWNRRAFSEMSEELLQDSKRHDIPLSLIMIDIDKFKTINDNYGHKAGDIVLKSFSKNLSLQIRDSDILSRIGGEEFVIVLPHSNLADATKKAEHFRLDTETKPIDIKDTILNITISIGVAQFNPKYDSLDTLLARADKAMYYVKSHGRNCVYSIDS